MRVLVRAVFGVLALAVLAAANGNKSEAARRLGVSRKTLERKCALWGVVGG